MQGLDVIKSERTKDSIAKLLNLLYADNMYDTEYIEDLVLFTEERENYSTIGTENIKTSVFKYILTNIYWINVCLFVNEDFRSCFDDAIAIEKALLRVNDQEYEDFRDEMTLNDDDNGRTDTYIEINIDKYNNVVDEAVKNSIMSASRDFEKAGMVDVYLELMKNFDSKTLSEISYVIHNLLYIINALNRNGVFNKYVRLVIESVKKQLA